MELTFSLRDALGYQYLLDELSPNTPYGAERVRRPYFFTPAERGELERAWRNVQAVLGGLDTFPEQYDRLARLLMPLRDLRGTLRRCREVVLTEVELFEVRRFLLQLELIVPIVAEIGGSLDGMTLTMRGEALRLLDPQGQRAAGFSIGGQYAKGLTALRDKKREVERQLRGVAEGPEREALLDARRTLVRQEEEETLAVRARLTEGLRPHVDALLEAVDTIGELDYTIQKAELARRHGAVMPRVAEEHLLMEAMDNPQLSDALKAQGRAFTRVSVTAPLGVTVVTGANMGGKSVALKTLALNVLLCQTGFFPFAARAELPLFEAVHVVSEDLSDELAGLSSFGAEVVRLREILREVDGGTFCLIALDEPARGTNPREGAALVRALVNRLSVQHAVTVIATHYDGVAERAQAHYQAAGLRALPESLPEGDRLQQIAALMNYGLTPVGASARAPQEALTVCRLLGLDTVVLEDMQRTLTEHDAKSN